ncbi:hypothetical protein NI17_015415 [Thermobifida halotolerans]|uniref:Uncharacterized protein n=1 Tax=Thermobifida halotolerans TaxID=483545 RepID=A0A399G3N0_9ACTN|nr:hypothetical protein [Thermobifida halotolerans]UOE18226.1 hypothetical protein NI17_015415 [Thermobifida halotolerans]
MRTLLALCALVLRAVRPSRGSHAVRRGEQLEPLERSAGSPRTVRRNVAEREHLERVPLAERTADALRGEQLEPEPRTGHRGEPVNVAERTAESPREPREPETGTASAPRAARGRPYAELVPAAMPVNPYAAPVPVTLPAKPHTVATEAALIRPYLVAWEREQERERTDRSRLGIAVLLDIARAEGTSQ